MATPIRATSKLSAVCLGLTYMSQEQSRLDNIGGNLLVPAPSKAQNCFSSSKAEISFVDVTAKRPLQKKNVRVR